jgi:hypothetical protein
VACLMYSDDRFGYARPTYGEDRRPLKGAISLAGLRRTSDLHA